MPLKPKRKANRKMICGKGYCTCQSKKYVHGKGIIDLFNSVKLLLYQRWILLKTIEIH